VAHEVLTLRLDVGIDGDDDAAELEDQTIQLRSELLELNVDAVERPPGDPAPEGSRGPEVALMGALLVEVSRGWVGRVMETIQGWVSRRRTRTVKVSLDGDSIEVNNLSDEDQRRLLEAFLARHTAT
jgi:hypothetical protein